MKRCAFALERGFFFHLLRFLWQKATYSSAAAFINSVKVQWTQSYILCPVSLHKVQMTIQYWGVLKYQRQKMFFFSNTFSFFWQHTVPFWHKWSRNIHLHILCRCTSWIYMLGTFFSCLSQKKSTDHADQTLLFHILICTKKLFFRCSRSDVIMPKWGWHYVRLWGC